MSRCSTATVAKASTPASNSDASARQIASNSRQQRNGVAYAACGYLETRATRAQRPGLSGGAPQRPGIGRWCVASARQGDHAKGSLRRCAGRPASAGAGSCLSERCSASSVSPSARIRTNPHNDYSTTCDRTRIRRGSVFGSNHSRLAADWDPSHRLFGFLPAGVLVESNHPGVVEFDLNQQEFVSKKVNGVKSGRRVSDQVRQGNGALAPTSESPVRPVTQPWGRAWSLRLACDRR